MSGAPTNPKPSRSKQLAAPVGPGDRYELIDIIRGFALFGVLVANMVLTTQDLAITDEMRVALPTAGIDSFATLLIGTLIDGKFFTLFSMLFGLGFAVQLTRASDRGVNVLPTYARRLAILFVIGVLHGVLLWFGDVLHIYAILGFVLIMFRHRSDRAILFWALGVLILVMSIPIVAWLAETGGWEDTWLFGREISSGEMHETVRHGGYADVILLNLAVHLQDYGDISFSNILFWYLDIFSKFLFGFYVGRRMLLQHAREHLGLFRRILPWAMVLGLGGSAYMNASWIYDFGRPESDFFGALLRALHEVWVILLSIGYACVLVLLHQRPRGRKYISCLAPLGRMALTNYLLQSVFLLLLFYGIGFGLMGAVGTSACILFSIVIFAAQIVASAWWLKRFRFGPVEWLWRSLTYGKLQPLRARPTSQST